MINRLPPSGPGRVRLLVHFLTSPGM